jgi:tetratricopeptide (TPR) repeat protein
MILSEPDQTLVDDEHPWLGLASFREQDEHYFKGRGSDIDKLRTLVERERLTVLFGASGLGKSSLLQAGLFPRLRLEYIFPVYVYIRLDFADTAVNLSEQVFSAITRQAQDKAIEAPSHTGNETLWEYFHRKDAEFWDARNRMVVPLLCFDQFEEIFTLGRENPQRSNEVSQFMDELADLVEGRCPEAVKARLDENPDEAKIFSFSRHPYKIILSLREDYLADLEGLRKWMPSIIHNRMRLSPMNGDQALAVADQTHGRLMETSVAESIVRLVAGKRGEDYHPLTELRIEPALLSLVCRELNERRIANNASQIDAQSVSSNREQILEQFYERSLKNQSFELRQFIEDKLITINGFRNSEAYDNALGVPGITPEALSQLVQQRLLRLEERDGVKRIELIHDVLTGVVRKSRDQRWILEKQRQAEAEAERTKVEEAYRSTQRRALVYLILVIISVIATGWAGSNWWMAKEARIKAQQALMTANQERSRSDKLLSFMLGEKLQAEMRDTGRSSALELMRKNSDENLVETSFNKGLALRNSGNLYYSRGNIDRAIQDLQGAQAIFEGLVDTDGDKAKIELARTLYQVGTVLSDRGKLSEAVKAYERAVQIRRDIVAQYSPKMPHKLLETYEQNSTPALELAEILDMLGGLYSRMEAVATALEHHKEAISIALDHLFEPINSIDDPADSLEFNSEPNYMAVKVLASALTNFSTTGGRKYFDPGLFIVREYFQARPLSALFRLDVSRIIFWRANNLDDSRIEEILEELEKVINGFEMLRRVDPDNLLWRHELAFLQTMFSNKLLKNCFLKNQLSCSDKDFVTMKAERQFLEGLEQLRELIGKDEANLPWKTALADVLFTRAMLLKETKSPFEEYMGFLNESIEIYSQLILDINDAQTRYSHAFAYRERASAWQDQGNNAEKALEDLKQARVIFEDLDNRLPDHLYFRDWLIKTLDDEINIRTKNGDDYVLANLKEQKRELESKKTNSSLKGAQGSSDDYQNTQWDKQKKIADEAKQQKKPEVAIAAYQTGIEALLKDVEAEQEQAAIWNQLAQAQYGLAGRYRESRPLPESIATYHEAILSAKKATDISPEKDYFQNWLHVIQVSLGNALQENNELEAARNQFYGSLIPLKISLKLNPVEPVYHINAMDAYLRILGVERALPEHDSKSDSRKLDRIEWALLLQRYHAAWKAMAFSSNQERTQQTKDLLMARRDLAKFLSFDKKDLKQARSLLEQVVIDAEKVVSDNPKDPVGYCRLGEADYAIGMLRRTQSLPGWEESIRKGLLAVDWGISIAKKEEPICFKFSGSYRKELGLYLLEDRRFDDGKKELNKALMHSQKALQLWPDNEEIKQNINENKKIIEIIFKPGLSEENSNQPSTPATNQPSIPIPAVKPNLPG